MQISSTSNANFGFYGKSEVLRKFPKVKNEAPEVQELRREISYYKRIKPMACKALVGNSVRFQDRSPEELRLAIEYLRSL